MSDGSSDVFSSDLHKSLIRRGDGRQGKHEGRREAHFELVDPPHHRAACDLAVLEANVDARRQGGRWEVVGIDVRDDPNGPKPPDGERRSEEHTSELQSLMRISYAVFCLKKKNEKTQTIQHTTKYQHLTQTHRQINRSMKN